MKLVFPELSSPIVFEEDTVSTLVIENHTFFRRFIEDLQAQINGLSGFSVLSDKDTPVPIAKHMDITTTFVPFELNRKSLLTKILSSMERTAQNETYFLKTQELLAHAEHFVADLSYEQPCELEFDKLSIGALLKAFGLRIYEEPMTTLSKVLSYMELVREYDRDRLFVFVNMRPFFEDKELTLFFETVVSHKFRILLIDSVEYSRLKYEKRCILDEDMCEIR